jgi:hypothetical protein
MPFNIGLLSDAALTGLSDTEKQAMQKQATQQFLLGSLLSGDPGIGFKSAMDIPSTSLSMQKMIRDSQIAQRQQDELAAFTSKFAPTEAQAGRRALNATLGREPDLSSPYALANKLGAPLGRVEPQLINQPIDYQKALSESLRLAGNPAQPQIRETLSAMQPKFVGDLRVDASGNVVGSVPTSKDGVQQQLNLATGQYSANPVQNYMMSRLMTTPPEVSANTMLGVGPTGAIQQMAIPGATEAVGAIESAKARAQAEAQVEQVVGADGKTYFVPRSSLLTQRPTTGVTGGVTGGAPSGAVAKISPAQEAVNLATSNRYNEFTKTALDAALTVGDRKTSAEYLYNAAEQLDPNKLTEFFSTGAAYMRAIPGVGDKFDSLVGNVNLLNKTRSEGVLKGLSNIKGNANAFEGGIVDRATTGVTDPKFVTKYVSALEIAAADKDDARQRFIDAYTGDPKAVYTAWANSPDNPRLYNHPKVNQFLNEQIASWQQGGSQGTPVMPSGFTVGRSKSTGAILIKKPDGSTYTVGQ